MPKTITLYRCRICGEAHIMDFHSSHCPFCGAHKKWLVNMEDYVEPERPELTAISRKNLIFTYELEMKAAQTYHCIRKKTHDEFTLGMFKALSKVELEHAELVGKLINRDPGHEIAFVEALCNDNREDALYKTKALESAAIEHYARFLHEAVEPEVKSVFQALLEAEHDHLTLVKARLQTGHPEKRKILEEIS